MRSLSMSTYETRRVAEYLGFRIHSDSEGALVAIPTFADEKEPTLSALTLPLLRKRIWQWWHLTDLRSN